MDRSISHRKEIIGFHPYTLGEELVNSISHGIGALLGIAGLILCIIRCINTGEGTTWNILGSTLFCTSIILLYLMSCLYHALKRNKAKYVFRIIDHCTIFLLIAGSYTPYLLIAIRPISPVVCWSIFAVIWTAAITGITLNAVDLKKFAGASVACYLIMGWLIILAYRKLSLAVPHKGITLLIMGGIAYSIGAILYMIGAKKRYFHSIFHFFCLAGTILHFLSVYLYVL